jgi:hypothetical protein
MRIFRTTVKNPAAMHYYMIDLIQFPSPHVPTEDYSHIMVGDEFMAVEIVVESMMMKAVKSPSPE